MISHPPIVPTGARELIQQPLVDVRIAGLEKLRVVPEQCKDTADSATPRDAITKPDQSFFWIYLHIAVQRCIHRQKRDLQELRFATL